MNRTKTHASLMLVSALAALIAFLPSAALAKGDGPAVSVGDTAPGFFLKTINSEAVGMPRLVLKNVLEDEATKAVVISFFATWCAPCKKELPVLQQLWKAYEKDGLRIVVISIDKEDDAVKSLSDFATEFGLTYPVVSDRFNLLARRYLGATTALPSLFITDGDGVIKAIHQSYDENAGVALEQELAGYLGITLTEPVVKPVEAAEPEVAEKAAEAAAEQPEAGQKAGASKKKAGKGKRKPAGVKKARQG
ncbi:MAG: TlpA disulfide reductase family protein [Deltaproteobacteria bacterium]|nr:TlpA disulfide reductase family protein [Deltaproteobacteria bacterium]